MIQMSGLALNSLARMHAVLIANFTIQVVNVHNLELIVEAHEGRQLSLVVWSSKSETYRRQ